MSPAIDKQIAPCYLIDNQSNLHIHVGEQRLVLPPAGALELIKFLERTQFQQNANVIKGVPQ